MGGDGTRSRGGRAGSQRARGGSAGGLTRIRAMRQPVPAYSVPTLMRMVSFPRVDILKMDIEGAEFSAIRGAEQTIRRARPKWPLPSTTMQGEWRRSGKSLSW